MPISITWLGHASVLAGEGVLKVYFDPWKLKSALPKADIIIVTHDHHDHYSEDDIKLISRQGTRVIAPFKSALITDILKPGETLDAGPAMIKAVPAYNIDKPFHPKKNNWAGYVVTLAGKSVYHPGDTDRIPEMKQIKADIALMPSGGTYTMSAKEAADAVKDVGASHAIPIHWGDIVGDINDAIEFEKLAGCSVHILKVNESVAID